MFIKADSHVTYQSTCVTKEINQSQISRKVGVTSKLNLDLYLEKNRCSKLSATYLENCARNYEATIFFQGSRYIRSVSFLSHLDHEGISTRLVELTEPSQDVLSIFSFVETASGELGIPKQLTDKR